MLNRRQNCSYCFLAIASHTFLSNSSNGTLQINLTEIIKAFRICPDIFNVSDISLLHLSKPFHLEELAARIRSLTRRQFTQNNVILSCGRVSFDTKSRTATADGQALTLTRKEVGILEYLLLNQGRPVSQEELIDHVWDNSVDNFSNSIRVHISALRKKLRFALGYDPIQNRIGEGYIMEEEKA